MSNTVKAGASRGRPGVDAYRPITDKQIAAELERPAPKRAKTWLDRDRRGLRLDFLPSGPVWRYRYAGRYVRLGTFNELSTKQARDAASQLDAGARADKDPTLRHIWERYMAQKVGQIADSSTEHYQKLWRCYLEEEFGRKRLSQITLKQVETWREKRKSTPSGFRAARQLMIQLYNHASRGERIAIRCPASDVENLKWESRKPLEPKAKILLEFFKMLEGFRSSDRQLHDLLLLQLLTATRVNSARGIEASEVENDNAGGVWEIPASRMKSGKEHRIPLTPDLRKLYDSIETLPFRWSSTKTIANTVADKVQRRLSYRFTSHWSRYWMNTLLADAGVSETTRCRITGHTKKGINFRYTLPNIEDAREGLAKGHAELWKRLREAGPEGVRLAGLYQVQAEVSSPQPALDTDIDTLTPDQMRAMLRKLL